MTKTGFNLPGLRLYWTRKEGLVAELNCGGKVVEIQFSNQKLEELSAQDFLIELDEKLLNRLGVE